MKFDRKESHKSGWDVMQDKVFSLYKDRGQEPLRKALVVFCGDTAVDGVNKTQGRLSFNEAAVISQGYGPINAAARRINAPVYLIDIGLQKDTTAISGILHQKVIHGTHHGYPAMDKETAERAVSAGMAVAQAVIRQGIEAVGLGHVGERYMLSALAVTTAALHQRLENATRKNGYRLHLKEVGNLAENPMEVLAATGSTEIVAMFGFITVCAKNGVAVVFDDAVSGAAALAATIVYPEVRSGIFPSLAYDEPVHKMQMQALHMEPMLHYGITGGAGHGAAAGLSLLDRIMMNYGKAE